jgi:hypothetical protein
VNGWGDWVNVNDDNGAKGYDFTTGGVSVGVEPVCIGHSHAGNNIYFLRFNRKYTHAHDHGIISSEA